MSRQAHVSVVIGIEVHLDWWSEATQWDRLKHAVEQHEIHPETVRVPITAWHLKEHQAALNARFTNDR